MRIEFLIPSAPTLSISHSTKTSWRFFRHDSTLGARLRDRGPAHWLNGRRHLQQVIQLRFRLFFRRHHLGHSATSTPRRCPGHRCRQRTGHDRTGTSPDHRSTAQFICADLNEVAVSNAKVIVLNFVLQFLEPAALYHCLSDYAHKCARRPLIVSEKSDKMTHSAMSFLTLPPSLEARQRLQRVGSSQKRQSLENVMRVDSEDIHLQRFADAGFAALTNGSAA